MALLEVDEEFLSRKGYVYDVTSENASTAVVIKDFPLPPAYSPQLVELLIRLPAGYPQGNPDMFWTAPHVQRVGGGDPLAASEKETHLGRVWQRWSRHWSASWRPGVDGLHTFIAATINELRKGV